MTALLSDLKTQILALCDQPGYGFITSPELTFIVNDSYSELYDLVVAKMEDYFTVNSTFTIVSSDDGYNLPVGIYKLRGVEKQFNGPNNYVSLRRFMFADRNKWNNTAGVFIGGFCDVCYDWVGGRIKIIPAGNAAGNYQYWYVPSCPILVNDSDSILYELQRWSAYIVIDSAIRILTKEETSADYLIIRKNELIARINASAMNRDAGNVERITDTNSVQYSGWRGAW